LTSPCPSTCALAPWRASSAPTVPMSPCPSPPSPALWSRGLDAHAAVNLVGQGVRPEEEAAAGAAPAVVGRQIREPDGADDGGADRGRDVAGQQDQQQYERLRSLAGPAGTTLSHGKP